ncbi:MAG: hypothetical protein ACQETG_00305 [Thermodesulfobacteriota bacterium]
MKQYKGCRIFGQTRGKMMIFEGQLSALIRKFGDVRACFVLRVSNFGFFSVASDPGSEPAVGIVMSLDL